MFTYLIATTEDKTQWEYDLGKSHRNPVDPETEVIEILFIYESGKRYL